MPHKSQWSRRGSLPTPVRGVTARTRLIGGGWMLYVGGFEMTKGIRCLAVAVGIAASPAASGQPEIIDSNLADSYFFVDHYEIVIDRSPEEVWRYILDLPTWMGLIHESGPRGEVGEVFRLYEGEDFFFETTNLIPNRLLVGVLQPFEIEGEESLGMGMLVLTDLGGKTLVSNFMSRHFAWFQEAPNPMRERRESAEYVESTQRMQNTVLARLKELVENER
jgi:hypothetical protein